MSAALPASVIVRTAGRVDQLRRCLESVAECRPGPSEVLVVDQSDGPEVAALATELGVRRIASGPRGRAIAANHGLEAASEPVVLFTDDDCTVAPDWIAVALAEVGDRPDTLVTGRVDPVGDPRAVPTYNVRESPVDYTGDAAKCDLSTSCLAGHRQPLLEIGGFDEQIRPTMEDWELGVRWIRSGRRLLYRPSMKVEHHDWRDPASMEEVWLDYGRGCARLYAKLVAQRDPVVLVFVARDLRYGLEALISRWLWGPAWWDPRLGVLRGMAGELPAALLRRPPRS